VRPELDDTHPAPSAGSDLERTSTAVAGSPPPTAPTGKLPAGKQLGHFRIDRALGAGGMGEVYLATDLALDRPVAIKVLPEDLARDAKRRERMIREARAQARVVHPNVVHMYFIGEDVDQLYFAMEYVPGQTLAQRIANGPMGVDDALAAIRDAALGLREAQRHGYTHRDVKPSNLMIDNHGMVKVLDFGLAAGDLESARAGGPVAQTSLAGTPLYMAPEQARGEAVDLRTDIYALGATLYHLIAGKPPFQSDSVDELLSAHATAARPGLPRRAAPRTRIGAIDALCAKMMAARPEDRFASYDDLLRAIELASLAHTRPAGFWARSLALAIDCLIMAVITGITTLAVYGANRSSSDGEQANGIDVDLSMFPLLLVYTTLATWRWGATAGKALFELEVVDMETGGRPRFTRALRRSLVMFGAPLAAKLVLYVFGERNSEDPVYQITEIVQLIVVFFGPILLAWASLRVSGKRTAWDRLSGTMVRYRTAQRVLGRA
jgi:uncharacterized RDD family membrane protein YckC